MHAGVREFVRALLPAFALAICNGCGGGGGSDAGAQGGSPAPAPAPTSNNRAPTISGAAAAFAQIDMPYEFQPAATDPDGDTLTFSAENLPPWVSFDSGTGRLSGTPTSDDVGEYESITISVADAAHQTTTSPFTIIVSGTGVIVATLQWEKPTSRVDGAPLEDLAGYRIVYGREPSDLDRSVFVDGADRTSYDFESLSPGIWYFAVIGVSASGLEGPATTPAMKSI